MPSWARPVTADRREEGEVLVGIWYAKNRASPVAESNLKNAIRSSGSMILEGCEGRKPSPRSVSSRRVVIGNR